METTDDFRNAIARIDRLQPPIGGNVIDLERVRLKRELWSLRGRLTPKQWQIFIGELAFTLAVKMQGDEAIGRSERQD